MKPTTLSGLGPLLPGTQPVHSLEDEDAIRDALRAGEASGEPRPFDLQAFKERLRSLAAHHGLAALDPAGVQQVIGFHGARHDAASALPGSFEPL